MRQRVKAHCDDKDHQPWPAQGRHTRHTTEAAPQERTRVFQADAATLATTPEPPVPTGPRLHLVDGMNVDTGTSEVQA